MVIAINDSRIWNHKGTSVKWSSLHEAKLLDHLTRKLKYQDADFHRNRKFCHRSDEFLL